MAPPVQPAPSDSRPVSSDCSAILNPSPHGPTRSSGGTSTSTKASSVVEVPRIPSLCSDGPLVKPGVPRRTMKAENPSPSPAGPPEPRAKTVKSFA